MQFDLAQLHDGAVLAVRRKVPPLSRRQIVRLPESLQESHKHWQESQVGAAGVERQRRRSRQLALSLLELGEDLESTERQLLRWRYHPAMAHDAAAWAWKRHQDALTAAETAGAFGVGTEAGGAA